MNEPTPDQAPPPLLAAPGGVSRARWWIHFLILAAYPVAVGLLSLGRDRGELAILGGSVAQLAMVVGIELAVFGLVFGAAWLASRASADDLLLRWRPRYWAVPLGVAYSVGLRLMVAMAAGTIIAVLVLARFMTLAEVQDFMIRNRPDIEAIIDPDVLRDDPAYFWLAVTVVSFVVGGLREELWRAALVAGILNIASPAIRPIWVQLAGVVLTAILFGAGHLTQGILAVGLTGLLGFGLGVIMVLHRSIWPAVIAHGCFNATSLALVPFVLEKLPSVPV